MLMSHTHLLGRAQRGGPFGRRGLEAPQQSVNTAEGRGVDCNRRRVRGTGHVVRVHGRSGGCFQTIPPMRMATPRMEPSRLSGPRFRTRMNAAGICDAVAVIGQCPDTSRALTLATLAGLSTTIGGAASVIRQPDNALLAFLLGTAIGVMATLSIVEMWLNNALEHGFLEVTLCAGLGVLLYSVLGPLVPEVELPMGGAMISGTHRHSKDTGKDAARREESSPAPTPAEPGAASAAAVQEQADSTPPPAEVEDEENRRKKLMRLGLLMAVTMTLHNLPEGFAVAFASFTDFGPKMAFAVAMHNIPEGIIVSAPIYASTGSRALAVGMSLASGLSEPAGAVIALAALGPYLSPDGLQLVLATVGGIMTAVCFIELLPEGRKCNDDKQLALGAAVGSLVMGATLAAGV